MKVKQIALVCAVASLPLSATEDPTTTDKAFAGLMRLEGAVARHSG